HQKSSLLLQHMLSALNVFVKAIGPTSRVQVCKLGEEIVPKLPYLWHNVASEELKDELLEFLQTQMWCHHPNGLKKDSPGAYAVDWDRWLSHLKKLYELMYSEMQQMGHSRNRGKISELKQAFVDLAVDVCQQIFSESSHTIEVTQISCTGSDGQTGPSAKKRRLESGWNSIRNFISSAGQTPKMVSWLQLVTGLVSRYTDSIPRDEVMPYLTCLSHALSDCKRTDLMVYIMRCIKSFVVNWDQIVTVETESLTEQSKSTWNQIWMVALRFVSLHNAEPEGYMLLSAMIERHLITPRKDIWSIFMPSLTRPITESIIFLCHCLAYCDFPENFVPNLAVAMPSAAADVKYPLRKQLIHWLLPSRDDETEMSRSHCKLNPDWTAHALMTLTLRDLSAKLKQCTSEKNVLSDLERRYLGSALEMPLEVEETLYKKETKKEESDPVHISTVLLVIENLIKTEVQYYSSRMEEQVSDVEETVIFARLITSLLSLLLGNQILTPQTIAKSGLYDSFVTVLKKMSNSLQEKVKKDGYANLCPVVKELRALFSFDGCDLARGMEGTQECRNVMTAICRAATPSKLADVLLDIANDKHCANKQMSSTSLDVSQNQSRFHRGASRLLDDFDDELDLDFEDQSNNNDAMEVEDLDFNDGPESQDSDDISTTNEVCQSLCSPCVLTESQVLRLEAIQALCHWCNNDVKLPVKVKSDVDVKYVKSKIVSLLEENVFDPSRAVDIQMMQHIVMLLTDKGNTVTENSFRTMVTAVRNCVKCHRRDQEICRTNLDLIIRLVPHLAENDSPPTSVLRECRESVLHLANAFWKLQEESYTSDVRCCLAKTMETLLQYDPDCKWSRFPSDQDEDSPSSQGDSGPTPAIRLVDCAGDVCHSVRMQAVSAIYKLFVDVNTPGMPPVDRNKQDQMFSRLFVVLNDSLDFQGRLSPERLEDEKLTRIASMLTALGTVICSSPVCEKLAVFSMMQFIKEKDVPVDMVQRILQKVIQVLGYDTHIKYIESYLPFFLHKWLQSGWSLTEFPYQLMGCENTRQFYRMYLSTIIPELVFCQNMESIEGIGIDLGFSARDLLKDSIPYAVVHILPVFAASKQLGQTDSSGMKKKISRATACYNLLTKELSEEVVDRQIVNSLDEIVANLLMCLHDTESDVGNIRDTNPEPNPPFYNTQTITWTLDYITSSFSGSGKTLVEILSKTTDSIQKILLELSVRLWKCHRMSEKRRTLFMYQLFTRLLLKQLHTQLGGAWVYVLRDVILRLVCLLKDITAVPLNEGTESCYRESIAGMALELLREVCQVGVDICPKELMKYLPLLASSLVSAVEQRGEVGQLTLSLLKFLILEKVKELRPAIAMLDSFPDKPEFKECRTVHHKLKYAAGAFTLKKEVEHFLSAGRNHIVDPDFRLEGLKFLYEQLKSEQKELQSLAKDDTLCRLACELVELTKFENRDVVLQASRCLGVLGPVNLRAISLPSAPSSIGLQLAVQCFEELPDVHKYCKIFHCLNTYLTDKSIELVQCASKVLKDLLSVKKGIEFYNGYKSQLGENEYLFHYLHPFRAGKKKVVTTKAPVGNWDDFQSTVDQELLWNPQHSNHGNWLITLTTTLISSGVVRDELLQLLEPVCSIKVEFCELVLPYMIHDILVSGTDDHREVVSRQVVSFFSSHCGQSRSGRISRCQSVSYANIYTEGEQSICMNLDSVRTMIDVIQYLRQQPRPKKGRQEMTIWDNNFWLDVDYLQVAMAAQYCSAHFTALLFAEIWCDVQREKTETGRGSQSQRSSQGSSQDTRIDTLSETSSSQSGVSVQDLLLEAYSWIGDPDGVYGCGAGRKADTSSRICTYQQENQWDKAVVSCDIQMSQSGTSNQYDLLNALQCFGANHVFNAYLQGIMGQEDVPNLTSDTRELQFEAAWRMGKWNIDSPNKIETATGFHESVFKAMKSIREDHSTFTDKALNNARLCAVSRLKDGCLTSARRLYPVLADLMCVNIVNQTTDLVKRFRESGSIETRDLDLLLDVDSDIKFTLPTLYMKCSAVKLLWEKTDNRSVFRLYVDSLHQLATSSREATRHQVSERAIATVKELDISDLSLSIPTQIEEAKLYWARGEENIAKPLLKGMIDKLRKLRSTDQVAAMFYPQALSIYGNWLAETRSENPNIIMENYMERAINMYEQLGKSEDKSVDAYLALAKYADAQYQNIVNYMNSSTYEAKQSLMRKSQQEADRLREVMKGESGRDRYLRTLEKQTEIDKHELECMKEDRNIFLLKAVHNYIKCLRCGDEHNLRVFRLTSLWFNNVHSEDVNSMMEEAVSEIKTYKWLPLMYQLAARMDVKPRKDTSQPFLQILNK
ncbi:serine-protein kinase ATM-like, partial [Mercenaria mercenaria]|uniref:serine-protein kinase ATM-like n=1 Tax=Mercenaria mercenaria TaxID=6596 RepID=UPI00234E8136